MSEPCRQPWWITVSIWARICSCMKAEHASGSAGVGRSADSHGGMYSSAAVSVGNEPGAKAVRDHDSTVSPGYRWCVLLIAWLSFLMSFIDRLAWANVAIPVGHALGIPLAALGIFVTAFYVGYVIANLV